MKTTVSKSSSIAGAYILSSLSRQKVGLFQLKFGRTSAPRISPNVIFTGRGPCRIEARPARQIINPLGIGMAQSYCTSEVWMARREVVSPARLCSARQR